MRRNWDRSNELRHVEPPEIRRVDERAFEANTLLSILGPAHYVVNIRTIPVSTQDDPDPIGFVTSYDVYLADGKGGTRDDIYRTLYDEWPDEGGPPL
jgi:hypothetical protein